MSDEKKFSLSNIGFTGLSDLSSDISDVLESFQNQKDENLNYKNQSISSNQTEKNPVSSQDSRVKEKKINTTASRKTESRILRNLMLVGLVIIVLLCGCALMENQDQNSPKISERSPVTSQQQTSSQQVKTLNEKKALSFQKPPEGSYNVLNVPQIRWCQRQKLIMDTLEPYVDQYSQNSINNFNSLVDDYNCRCGSFKYRKGDLERAKRDVDSMRAEIIAETLSSKTKNGNTKGNAPSSSNIDSSNKQKQLILSVQKKLKALGYNPGSLDGVYGKKTEKAIREFQKDAGLEITGEVNSNLVNDLKNAQSNSAWLKHRNTSSSRGGTNYFTIGSSEEDVLRLQGTPSQVATYSFLGTETLSYGYSTVEISTVTNKVIKYSNSGGNLKVKS